MVDDRFKYISRLERKRKDNVRSCDQHVIKKKPTDSMFALVSWSLLSFSVESFSTELVLWILN
mgnify:CR=1 FL=1